MNDLFDMLILGSNGEELTSALVDVTGDLIVMVETCLHFS